MDFRVIVITNFGVNNRGSRYKSSIKLMKYLKKIFFYLKPLLVQIVIGVGKKWAPFLYIDFNKHCIICRRCINILEGFFLKNVDISIEIQSSEKSVWRLCREPWKNSTEICIYMWHFNFRISACQVNYIFLLSLWR